MKLIEIETKMGLEKYLGTKHNRLRQELVEGAFCGVIGTE